MNYTNEQSIASASQDVLTWFKVSLIWPLLTSERERSFEALFIQLRSLHAIISLSGSCRDLQPFSASHPLCTPSVVFTPTDHQSYRAPLEFFEMRESLTSAHVYFLILLLFILLNRRSLYSNQHCAIQNVFFLPTVGQYISYFDK